MGLNRTSELTKIDWVLGFIAFLTETGLGLSYIFSSSRADRTFGFVTLLEGTFALFGLLLIDVLNDNPLDIYPDNFKKLSTNTLYPLLFNFIGLFLIQLILQFPLTVRTFDKALAVMFAGPSEELFFRGLLLTPFIKWGKDDYKFEIANPISTKRKILSISIVEIFGITFSTLAFTFLHINYYGNPTLLLIVALSGIVLGLVYQKYQDLTANILAHFFLNLIVTIRIFGQLTF